SAQKETGSAIEALYIAWYFASSTQALRAVSGATGISLSLMAFPPQAHGASRRPDTSFDAVLARFAAGRDWTLVVVARPRLGVPDDPVLQRRALGDQVVGH